MELCQIWAEFDQHQSDLAGLDQIGADVGQLRAEFDKIWANIDQRRPYLAGLDRIRADLGCRACFMRIRRSRSSQILLNVVWCLRSGNPRRPQEGRGWPQAPRPGCVSLFEFDPAAVVLLAKVRERVLASVPGEDSIDVEELFETLSASVVMSAAL